MKNNKIKIRLGMFENNSSSSHSLVFQQHPQLLNQNTCLGTNDDGVLALGLGEYGWGYETVDDCWGRADYCAIDIYQDKEKWGMLKKVIMDYCPEIKDVIIVNSKSEYREDGDPSGYIDHQSNGTSLELFESEEKLRNFIFGSGNYIIIDNDNH